MSLREQPSFDVLARIVSAHAIRCSAEKQQHCGLARTAEVLICSILVAQPWARLLTFEKLEAFAAKFCWCEAGNSK